jgi:hypothetical protein
LKVYTVRTPVTGGRPELNRKLATHKPCHLLPNHLIHRGD